LGHLYAVFVFQFRQLFEIISILINCFGFGGTSGTILRGGRSFPPRTNGPEYSDAADEKKGEEEIELSDADIDAVSDTHADTPTAANIAAVQAADPGAIVFTSSSPFYSQR
jgi:hypothetical protein